MAAMHVVIVGVTGNVGTAVLRRLAAERVPGPGGGGPPVRITGVARRVPVAEAGPPAPYDAVSDWVRCDISAPDSTDRLSAAMAGADAVVHAAWAIQPSHSEDTLVRTNVEGSRRVVDAALLAGVPHLVYLSSVGAYAPGQKDRLVDEGWPTDGVPTSSYSRHKAAVEGMFDQVEVAQPELVITRFRPGLIFQRDAASEIIRYFIGPLAPLSLLRYVRPPVLPLDDRLRFQVVHADDVAEAVAVALWQRSGGAFNLAAEPVVTPERLASVLGARHVPVDARLLRAAAAGTWRLYLQPSEPGWIDLAVHAPLLDSSRARRVLGWKPAHESLAAVAELLTGMAHGTGIGSPPLRPREHVATRLAQLATARLPGTHSP
jgi:nucleoside-diphosphate-sugar epimerase